MTELAKMDSCFSVYFRAVAFLHVAYKSSRHGLYDELIDVLAQLFGQLMCRRHHSNNATSLSLLGKAATFMKIFVNKSLSTMSLITIELSKAYLFRALKCTDSGSDSIYCLANVYLAVLYIATGQYQTAIYYCKPVIRSQDHSRCSSHVVQGELLPKTDDSLDNLLGLAVFYHHITKAAFYQHYHSQHVSVLTTELFAYYLDIKSSSLTVCRQFSQTSSTDKCKQYEDHIYNAEQLFICDVLLFVSLSQLLKQRFRHKPVWQQSSQMAMNSTEYNISDLVQLLLMSAVEQLSTFRLIEARYVGSVAAIVTTDFQALYAYKHGDFQQCLQLSSENVHTLLYDIIPTPDVATFPEFSQLMDDDIVSLTALTLIVNPECRDYPRYVYITQLTLSLCLMIQCQLKLHHSVTSLAKTLDYIKFAYTRHPPTDTLCRLVLKMIAQKALTHIESDVRLLRS